MFLKLYNDLCSLSECGLSSSFDLTNKGLTNPPSPDYMFTLIGEFIPLLNK